MAIKDINLQRVEKTRQAFMRGEISAEHYWNVREQEYSKAKKWHR